MNIKNIFILALIILTSCKTTNKNLHNEKHSYSIEQLLKIEITKGGDYSPDYNNIIYISNKTGNFNVWIYDIATKKSKLLIESDQNINYAFYAKNNNIYYIQDNKGDENHNIYEYNISTKKSKLIIGGSKIVVRIAQISQNGEELFYTTNERDKKLHDFYKYNFKSGKKTSLWEAGNNRKFIAFFEDKDIIITEEIIMSNKEKLYIYNTKTKQEKLLAENILGKRKPNYYLGVKYSYLVYGDYFYFMSNYQDDFQQGYKINILTGEINKIISANWDVVNIGKSAKEKYWFYTTNENAKKITRVFSDEFKTEVKNLLGKNNKFGIEKIQEDEKHAILVLSNDISPNIIFAGTLFDQEYNQITNNFSSNINAKDLVFSIPITYKSRDNVNMYGYLYLPKTSKPSQGFPLIVDVHGGPNYQFQPYYNATIQYLVNQGYAIFAPQYRGSDGYGKKFMDLANINGVPDHGRTPLFDVIDGKNYILQNYKDIDPNRVGIMGGSWGGYMTLAALAFTPSEFKLGIDIVGPSDIFAAISNFAKQFAEDRENINEVFGNPDTQAEHLKQRSPLFSADKIKAPLLILHGKHDVRVKYEESLAINDVIKKNGGIIDLHVYDNEGHGFRKTENVMDSIQRTSYFLNKYL